MMIILKIINSSKVGAHKYLQNEQKHRKDPVTVSVDENNENNLKVCSEKDSK